MIRVYGICDRPDLPPPRLDALREGALLAVFSGHAPSVAEPSPDALWEHERVVEELMADRTVLPMRFGSEVRDEEELRRVLRTGQESFLAALARVRGRVELSVRAVALDAEPARVPVAASGRDYLLGRLSEGRRVGRLASSLHVPLAALAADTRRHSARSAEEVLRGAYLVDRPAVPRFRAAVERLQSSHSEVAVLCTGPWPPYSFVGDAGAPR
jgi:hypothetical protein